MNEDDIDAAIAFAISNGVSSYKLSRKLGIHASTLCRRADKLGLTFHSARFWSEEELSLLRELAATHTAEQLADRLGRPVKQVTAQLRYRHIPWVKTRD